ncbi:MAG: hypothetical protein NTX25_10425, partial [Proteobacteria bacterium]|nr:hypothetical protein [Pseudomonadota bacterium]
MRRFLQSAHFLGLIFSMTGVFCLFLGASSRLTAEEKDADDTSCRDIGDIFCLLEEFSASLDYSFGFSAKIGPGPNLPKSLPQRT